MDSRRRAYFSPCAARCRSHAGFFTSGSLPVYGPTGALAAVPTGGAASARHRTTETEPRGSPLPPRPTHTGGRSGRARGRRISRPAESGAPDFAASWWCGGVGWPRWRWVRSERWERFVSPFYPWFEGEPVTTPGWFRKAGVKWESNIREAMIPRMMVLVGFLSSPACQLLVPSL